MTRLYKITGVYVNNDSRTSSEVTPSDQDKTASNQIVCKTRKIKY